MRAARLLVGGARRLSSALYRAGDQTAQPHVVVTPHIDLEKKLEEMTKLQANVELRRLEMDPMKLKSLWDFLKSLESTRLQLEKRRVEIADHMKDLKKIGNDSEARQEMEKLKVEGRIVREDLKTLMKAFWEVEEKVMMNGLSLPNELHEDTPEKEERVVRQFATRPHVNQTRSHVELGAAMDLLEFRDPSCYYLKNEAAGFETGLLNYFAEGLKADGFVPFSSPDFARSAVVEGCGRDHTDPGAVLLVREAGPKVSPHYRLHLVGGASHFAFCAFHAKQTVDFSSLPLKYCSMGRQYSPGQQGELGLLGAWQRSCVEVFALTRGNPQDMAAMFRGVLETLSALYEDLGFHFRVAYLSAGSLHTWESLRASFQMYSCHQQRYVEVGRVSLSDDYICQRLQMAYRMSDADDKVRFPKMLSGTAVDVGRVLACVLEQGQGGVGEERALAVPETIRRHALGLLDAPS